MEFSGNLLKSSFIAGTDPTWQNAQHQPAFERYFQGQATYAKQAYVEARKLHHTYNGKSHPKVANAAELLHINGGSDETRTRDLRRDRPAF
jgi:outer membrane protein assembly factor BamD (BamD/ComL family)